MKRIIRILANVFIALVALLVAIIIFLFVYYEVQDHKRTRMRADLSANHRITTIDADTIAVTGMEKSLLLLPVPQKYEFTQGTYSMPDIMTFTTNDSALETVTHVLSRSGVYAEFAERKAAMAVSKRTEIHSQGYRLQVDPAGISIQYADEEGLYFGLVTLKILNRNYKGKIPCIIIEDYPDLAVRGLMLDISRDKVPKIQTLEKVVTLISDLKFNHLELYVEGFSFAYPSFASLWEGKETPVTGPEIRVLDSLCSQHYIELVPNQNSLGHMMAWLGTEQYAHLAECPNGYKLMGLINMKGTLDPENPGSIQLVTRMADDMLPWFTSDKFNVNLDEPFELGKGKSRKTAKKTGIDGLYLDYTVKLHEMVTQRNHKMMMWGDIAMRHPAMLKKLPRDITLLDWGYEAAYPFEKNCRTIESSGISYMVCPGTSSWTSITGRTDNMLANIASAAVNGTKYNAAGLLVTDWGDMGHWQYLPVSYAGYTTAGALSWNSKTSEDLPLVSFLNSYIFKDNRQIMGDLVLDLGRYKQFEEVTLPNMTTTMLTLQFGLNDRLMVDAIYDKILGAIAVLMKDIAPELIDDFKKSASVRRLFDFSGMNQFLNEKEALLNLTGMQVPDSNLIRDEYRNAIRLIRVGTDIQQYAETCNEMNAEEQKSVLQTVKVQLNEYLKENQRLWLLRNKPGGYERSTAVLKNLEKQIDQKINVLNQSAISRMVNRFFEKVKTAAAVIYVRYL